MTPDDVRIRVLSDRRASPDGGEHFHNYVVDQVYARGTVPPMSPGLAAEAVREGWGEVAPCMHAPAREAPAGPDADAACLWCGATYHRRTTGGSVQRFCSTECRSAFHLAARRWTLRQIDEGRLEVGSLREL